MAIPATCGRVVPLAIIMGSPQYTALPLEEKMDPASADEIVSPSLTWKKPFLIVTGLISLFLLVSLVVVDVSPNVIYSTLIDNAFMRKKGLLPKATVTGDQYLLGVGKADITGLVQCIFREASLTVI
jgi:hypothetical protein